jgi:hypothetical protein
MPKGGKTPEWLSADVREFYDPSQPDIRAIQRAIREKRGVEIPYMTVSNRMDDLGLERPRKKAKRMIQEATMSDEPVEVLPGQMAIEDADTAPEVHYGAVNEFDRLPDGYAKEIQPMRKYTDAEEWALDKSIELYGFQGAIVRDQYGRILDGHHRQKLARLRGLGVPFTKVKVRDDVHAQEIAKSLNTNRRHFHTIEQRQELASAMRDQGFSYRMIAVALGVSKDTVQRDIFGQFQLIPAPEEGVAVSPETPLPVSEEPPVSHETSSPVMDSPAVSPETPPPEKRITGMDGKRYPDRKPSASTKGNGTKVSAQDKQIAKVIEMILQHSQGWDAKHWAALMETIQSLRPTSHTSAQ